jgi:hypothetical protein
LDAAAYGCGSGTERSTTVDVGLSLHNPQHSNERGSMSTTPKIAAASVLLLAGCSGTTTTAATTTVTQTVQPTITQTVTYTPPPPPGPATQLDGEGIFVVGTDIVPGRWRTAGGGSSCYWARLGDLTGDEILDNSNSTGPQVVDIVPSDVAFQLRHCQPWYLASGG